METNVEKVMQLKKNVVKDHNWQDAGPLAICNRYPGAELGTTENNTS